MNKEGNFKAHQLAEEVIRLDPHSPAGYFALAAVTSSDVFLGISDSPVESLMKAVELYRKPYPWTPSDALPTDTWASFTCGSGSTERALRKRSWPLN